MLLSSSGAANPEGSVSMTYKKDEVYDMSSDWQQKIANSLVASNLAMEVKIEEVKEEKIQKDEKKTKKKITKILAGL